MNDFNLKKIESKIIENKHTINELISQIESLEKQREERLVEVTRNNADTSAQYALSQIEKQIETSKQQRRILEKETVDLTQQYKQISLQKTHEITDDIQVELIKAREERDRLRTELIPAAQRKLQELEERKRELDSQVLSLSNQLAKLNKQSTSDRSSKE